MTTKRRYSCDIDRREEQHLKLLDELDLLPLSDSCCEICHCDCYNSHRSTDTSEDVTKSNQKKKGIKTKTLQDSNNNNKSDKKQKPNAGTTEQHNSKVSVKKKRNYVQSLERRNRSKSPAQPKRKLPLKRSKSAGSLLSSDSSTKVDVLQYKTPHYTRDCELLQDLLSSLDTPRFEITGNPSSMLATTSISKSTLELPTTSSKAAKINNTGSTSWSTPKICKSLANLCLTPAVREAYQQVSFHDKKILNRMANKRSEKIVSKENAWLARKFWENERYERELLKCEQMEEYKRAIRDKQFQDYVLTKERLNELAQRDYQELQRLRALLAQKDALTKKRLDTIRVERDILLCQRRCEELRKSEAVNLHQEEQNLDDALRKREICSRLSQRLRRADEIRNQMLDGYLKRLRYDNYVEQLVHEEHWRETQEMEFIKRTQLKEHIDAKTKGTQRFIEQRNRRMEALSKSAKISASLRELVRNSMTPEGTLALGHATSTANLGKLLFDRPISKLSIQ